MEDGSDEQTLGDLLRGQQIGQRVHVHAGFAQCPFGLTQLFQCPFEEKFFCMRNLHGFDPKESTAYAAKKLSTCNVMGLVID